MSEAWERAKKSIAGGVNSPVRAFKAVGGDPVFMRQGLGAVLYDNKDRAFVDYCLSWGAILLGHADEGVAQAVSRQAVKGTSFGTATEYETTLAEEIKKAFPGMERMRFTSSGTEAVMSAIRLARGLTHRDRIIKFEGCYHGHADSLLVKAGSGLATFGSPDSDGVPQALAELTTVLPYNDSEAVRTIFKKHKDIACIIVEPIAGNMGLVPGKKEFLDTLRRESARHGALLIFDEVISGFRVHYGGAQHLYGISPDLTILGKVIGGGLPIGAFGGKKELMAALSPDGKVYQAGTLSGNPLSMAAGYSVLKRLSPNFYNSLKGKSAELISGLNTISRRKKEKIAIQSIGSMFTIFFTEKTPNDFSEALFTDTKKFKRFFNTMLSAGIYFPPSAFETSFISEAHGSRDFKATLLAFESF